MLDTTTTETETEGGTDYEWLPDGFSVSEIETNGARLSVAVGGSGPALVLLHGWPQTGRAWREIMPGLALEHTVVVPDLRGTGASERPEGGYRKIDQAQDMRGLLAGLDLKGPAIVVGHDIGAMVATAWAAKYPEDVAALVILDAVLPGMGLEEMMDVAKGGSYHFGLFMTPEIPELLFDGHVGDYLQWTFSALSGSPDAFSGDDIAFYARSYTGADRLRGGFGHYRTLLQDGEDNRELLADHPLPMPVLVIGGELTGGDRFAQGVAPFAKQMTTAVAPGGHFIAEEAPDWLLGKLRDFVASSTKNSKE